MSITRMQLVAGDALSQIIQVLARQVGVSVLLTGKGQEDLAAILIQFKEAKNRADEWAQAIRDIIEFADTTPDCPESVKAYVVAAVLRARVNFDARNMPKVPR